MATEPESGDMERARLSRAGVQQIVVQYVEILCSPLSGGIRLFREVLVSEYFPFSSSYFLHIITSWLLSADFWMQSDLLCADVAEHGDQRK